jgi:hypothetical protein
MANAYFSVKGFEKFQHYKDRNPPWIKLYNELLDNYEFGCLQDASKLHLILIWLLASRHNNRLPWDAQWIAKRINASDAVDLDALQSAGFIEKIDMEQSASKPLATCPEIAMPETEVERETETEEEEGDKSPAHCPHKKIIALYHEILPLLPRMKSWDETRQGYLQARWKQNPKHQSLDWWREFFTYVAGSKFLTGQSVGKPGMPPFVADLEWLVRPTNFAKVIEGKYHREAA